MTRSNGFTLGNPGVRLGLAVVLVSIAVVPVASAADAETGDEGTPKALFDSNLHFALGGFFPRVESTLSLDSSSGSAGTEISSEDDLGLDKDTASPWVGFNWRFLPRHQFQGEWFELNRDGTKSASRQLNFGNTTAFTGASLSSKVDLNIGRLTYGYSVLRKEEHDLSILAGAHIATMQATITASGSIAVSGGPAFSGTSTESSSTYTIPLPHVGGSYSYKFAPRWTLDLMLLGFALEFDEYKGYLVQAQGLVSYQLTKHFGLGGGLKYFELNLQADGSRLNAEFDYQFYGPAIYGLVTF